MAVHKPSYGPNCEKTCLPGFRQCEFQTSLLSYRDQIEKWNFTWSMFTYDSFQKANNKGADQTLWMRRLVCACVVPKPPKTGFLASRPILPKLLIYMCLTLTALMIRLRWQSINLHFARTIGDYGKTGRNWSPDKKCMDGSRHKFSVYWQKPFSFFASYLIMDLEFIWTLSYFLH